MNFKLVVPLPLTELIRHLSPEVKRKIRVAIDELSENPRAGKALTLKLKGMRSYRVGRMRIVYRTENSTIKLIDIGPRRTIYQKVVFELTRKKL